MKFNVFHEVVAASWDASVDASCPVERLSIKFKRLSQALKSFGQWRVGHVNQQFMMAREVLHRLEIAQDSRDLSYDEVWLRGKLKRHYLELASLEWNIARLRSRIYWLSDGDANTLFFLLQASFHRIKNFIGKCESDDRIVTAQEDKQ